MYKYDDHLETERLTTRYLVHEDYELLLDFFDHPEATQFMPPFEGTSEDRAKFWIEFQHKRYQEQRYGLQALIDKKTNRFIGQCGLLTQEVDGIKELEVGYHILPQYWGKGYAPEAAKRFMDYGFENLVSNSIISIIVTQNIKSIRVAEKNGLTRDKQARWKDLDVFIYRMKRS